MAQKGVGAVTSLDFKDDRRLLAGSSGNGLHVISIQNRRKNETDTEPALPADAEDRAAEE